MKITWLGQAGLLFETNGMPRNWDYRLHIWGKRFPTWDEDGVYLDGNSNAVFRIFEKNGEV